MQALGQGGKAAILTFARPVALFVPLVLILPNVAGLGIHGRMAASALSDGVMIVVGGVHGGKRDPQPGKGRRLRS